MDVWLLCGISLFQVDKTRPYGSVQYSIYWYCHGITSSDSSRKRLVSLRKKIHRIKATCLFRYSFFGYIRDWFVPVVPGLG